MNFNPSLTTFTAAIPALSRGLGIILPAIAAVIARAFLRDPRHVGLILPLHGYITRTLRRLDRLLARLAAGTLRPRAPRTEASHADRPAPAAPRKPRLRLPTRHAWLVVTLRHEAAGYASQLRHLLSDPAHAQLIAATPQAGRLLRPLCHLLGIAPDCIARPKPPAPARAAIGREADRGRGPSFGAAKDEGAAVGTPPPALPSPPHIPGYPTPPCEHITWWPWFPPRSERIA